MADFNPCAQLSRIDYDRAEAAGNLMPNFIFVANIESSDPQQIISGNEKVVRPRLADAEFFFKTDRKQRLEDNLPRLETVLFQQQLGTLRDKTDRLEALAGWIASKIGADVNHATRAGLLAKCDLTSELVGEFPELQGIAGTYYARLEGENHEVAEALGEQYLPKFAGDVLPQTKTGTTIALADRLDTLVGIFGIGQAPTGSKDPFALRRSAIGILRLIIENELDVTIEELVNFALQGYGDVVKDHDKTRADAVAFLEGRYRAKYEDQGVAVDVIQAVQALSPKSPLDFDKRVTAVNHFRSLPEAAALAAANKRVANILAKEAAPTGEIVESKLVEDAEKALYAEIQNVLPVVQPLLAAKDYTAALSKLAALRAPIDAFFDGVMVMADDSDLKANRLRLLAQLRDLFTSVADISVLQH